ncbi:glycosyltransferase [Aquincola sp. MAHUQ-54]|uniref:Glycosyltransferase n=1 Tax=Aquincola agrisoli TaxID=3119538 RepID=A0AAW9QAJ3_9BURK
MARRLHIYVPHLGTGGGELSLMRLAEGLARTGWDVTFIVHGEARRPAPLPAAVGIRTLQARRTLDAIWKLARFIRREKVELLLTAFPHGNAAAVAARALSGSGCRLVLSDHAPLAQQVRRMGGWRYRLVPWMVRWCYPRADAVVGVSSGVCEDLRARLPANMPPRLIYNPVLPPDLGALCTAPAPHPWLADPGLKVVLSVSRLSREKNLGSLLQAFAQVARDDASARLVVAGDGPEKAALEQLARGFGLADRVHFPGEVRNPFAWMSRARVFVLASQFEGFGNVLVEALAAGAHVVSTDCPVGPREILRGGDLGALVPVDDAPALSSAIAMALARPPRAVDRQSIASYTQDRSCAAYASLFESLTAAPR